MSYGTYGQNITFITGHEAAMLGGKVAARGEPADVEAWRVAYFRDYHPAGYGTRVTRTVEHSDGTVTIVVTRSASCD